MKIIKLMLILLAVSCGVDNNNSNVNAFASRNGTVLTMKWMTAPAYLYCAIYQKDNKTKLLTKSGGITISQVKQAIRQINNESMVNWTVVGLVAASVGVTQKKPLVTALAGLAIGLSLSFIVSDLIVTHQHSKHLTSDEVYVIQDREMDRLVRRISSQYSSYPGSCNKFI